MKKYIKGNKIINATDKAYDVIYKNQGYMEVKETEKTSELNYNSISFPELKSIAAEKGINTHKMKKQEIINALEGQG